MEGGRTQRGAKADLATNIWDAMEPYFLQQVLLKLEIMQKKKEIYGIAMKECASLTHCVKLEFSGEILSLIVCSLHSPLLFVNLTSI